MVHTSVIGCGNMGGAIVRGLAATDHRVTACDVEEGVLAELAAFADETTTDTSIAAEAPIVIVAVKPDGVADLLAALDLGADQTVVSVAAGVSTDFLSARTDATVVRLMPNLAAEYGEMAAAVTPDPPADVAALLSDLGTWAVIDESDMDLATAINGSGPAFVFYLIEAMAAAGIDGGFESDAAAELAAQTFKGAAETVLQSDRDIEQLIDAVCSPGGTTIEGMEVLFEGDCDEQVQAAITAAERRSAEMTGAIDDA